MVFIQPEAQKFLELNRDASQLDTRTPEENRAAQQKTAAAWGKKTPMVSVYETSVRGVTVRVYVPQEPALADAPTFHHRLPAVMSLQRPHKQLSTELSTPV